MPKTLAGQSKRESDKRISGGKVELFPGGKKTYANSERGEGQMRLCIKEEKSRAGEGTGVWLGGEKSQSR